MLNLPLTEERARVLQIVGKICARLGAIEAWVFGSFARDTQTRRSDVDVLVVEDTTLPFIHRAERYHGALVAALPHRAVEILVYRPEELEAMRQRPLIGRALVEGVRVVPAGRDRVAGAPTP